MGLGAEKSSDKVPLSDRLAGGQLGAVRAYHQRTKHLPEQFAPGPGYMDWANQPDPFRRFKGARLVELPFVSGPSSLSFGALTVPGTVPPEPLSLDSLGLFLELALGLTAWKEFQGTRWALRSNPSSGNLHPTEGYLFLPAVYGLSGSPGVYHYASREHALEQRCSLSPDTWLALIGRSKPGGFIVGLSSIHWREAWKYGERAYRYCQHDVGHAVGSSRYAAAALGWRMHLLSELSDVDLSTLMGLNRKEDFQDVEPEFPDLLCLVHAHPQPPRTMRVLDEAVREIANSNWRGRATKLSAEWVHWPWIESMETNAAKPRFQPVIQATSRQKDLGPHPVTAKHSVRPPAVSVIRQRRSAVAMDGHTSVSLGTFLAMLGRTMPDPATVPWDVYPFPARILLCLFVHRVDGLQPGLYALIRDPDRLAALRAACRNDLAWKHVSESGLPLYQLMVGDFRDVAAHISCTQAIAGDSAFSLGMIADFVRTLKEEGAWAYRRLFWEAGLIGQVLYLEAEAAGVQATGMGCYFDDLLHCGLGLDLNLDDWQSLYHFTVGGAVEDRRLTTLPAYFHLPDAPPLSSWRSREEFGP
jgi:SagB-type dehydrogenase family enzyme